VHLLCLRRGLLQSSKGSRLSLLLHPERDIVVKGLNPRRSHAIDRGYMRCESATRALWPPVHAILLGVTAHAKLRVVGNL
jgi:hypothetical protein